MNHLRIAFVGAVVLFLTATSATSQTIPLDTAVHTGKLANGFTYYIRHNNEPKNRVYLYLVNKVGSVLEDPDQQGLAHFMEHMNFNGTTHFPKNDLVDYLQKSGVRFGADLNAYTSFDETVYQLPIPADNPEILKNGFQIMRDWAQDATLDGTEIDKERGVVLEEQRLGRGAQERMGRQYYPVILNNSRYAERLPIGKVDILKNFNYESIRRFHQDWYRPDLQALVVVGDIDPVSTEILVKQLFSDLKTPANERVRTEYTAPLNGKNHFLIVTDNENPQTVIQIMVKHKEELLITEQDYIHSMQRQIFNQMIAQRFTALLQTKDLPFVEADADINGFMGGLDVFSFEVGLKKDKLAAGFQTAWETIEQIKRFGFSQKELERAQLNYLAGLESSFREKNKTNSENFVGEYQRHFLRREASPGISWEYEFVKNHIASISLEQINALTEEYIQTNNRDILVFAPEDQKSALPDSSTVISWINAVSNKKLTAFKDEAGDRPLITNLPEPGKITSTKFDAALNVTTLTLSNGAKVILKPTDFKNDEIRFEAFASGGSSVYDDADYQNAHNATMITAFGLSDLNPVQLENRLSGKRVDVSPYVKERTQGITGTSTVRDLETALQLTNLYFTAPRKDTIIFNNIINNSRETLFNRDKDPATIFADTIGWVLGNYNFRRQPPTIEKLNELDLEKIIRIYKERFSDASNFTFIFTGAFSIDSIRPLLVKYIGSLPATHKKEEARDLGIHIPYGKLIRIVHGGKEDKATVKMIFSGAYTYNADNNLELQALKEVLAIKITQHLREDESEVYSPNVQVAFIKLPHAVYSFAVSFGCAPANASQLMKDVEKEIATIRLNGPTQEDIDKFKAEYKRVQELNRTENNFWVNYLVTAYQNHDKPSPPSDNLKNLNKLTPASLKTAAQKYLNGENVIRFELLPIE